MFNFDIGIPKIKTNGIGSWVKPIGTLLGGLISPTIKNIFSQNQKAIEEQTNKLIQDKTDENIETGIGGNMQPNNNKEYFPIENYTPNGNANESTTQEPTTQEPTTQEPEKPLGSSDEKLTVSDNANIQKAFENLKAMQQEQWNREDEIRKHVEEREDNAYQRAREDAEKAGINLNLLGINPAQSGGGITNATGADYSMYNKEFESSLNLIMQEIEQNFKGTEAEKERFAEMIGKVIQLFGFMALKG